MKLQTDYPFVSRNAYCLLVKPTSSRDLESMNFPHCHKHTEDMSLSVLMNLSI